MKNRITKWVLSVCLGFLLMLGISWLGTCGIIKLVTLCFGWSFSWLQATGIWLILCLLSSVFSVTVKK